jgi:epoxyqueuosine reductase
MNYSIPFSSIKNIASRSGIQLVSALCAKNANTILATQKDFLSEWQRNGNAADMKFMERSPDLFCSLQNFLPEVKSIMVCTIPYATPREEDPPCPSGYGRVARYARGRDYHLVLREILLELVTNIKEELGYSRLGARVFTDAVPLLERAIAANSGLGFIGKSAMNILPRVGTYTFIGEVLLDIEIEDIPPLPALKSSCGSCQNCIRNCPTDAFIAPRVLDARKCISYLTIEKRTSHTGEETSQIGNWVFGCDVCQEVCPFNHHGKVIEPRKEFGSEYGVGARLDLTSLLTIRVDSEFKKRFKDTPLLRAKREGLLRNALSVLQNQRYSESYIQVMDCYQLDVSPVVRVQARQVLESFLEFESGRVLRDIKEVL